jgi:hypothetical protein
MYPSRQGLSGKFPIPAFLIFRIPTVQHRNGRQLIGERAQLIFSDSPSGSMACVAAALQLPAVQSCQASMQFRTDRLHAGNNILLAGHSAVLSQSPAAQHQLLLVTSDSLARDLRNGKKPERLVHDLSAITASQYQFLVSSSSHNSANFVLVAAPCAFQSSNRLRSPAWGSSPQACCI